MAACRYPQNPSARRSVVYCRNDAGFRIRDLTSGMATHCSIPAWRILWTEEPGRPQSLGCKESDVTEVGRD